MGLLPEWHPQEAVLLAWPDETTDWAPWLSQVQQIYVDLIDKISQPDCAVLLLINENQVEMFLRLCPNAKNLFLIKAEYNDTWIRDYGFLTCHYEGKNIPVEFTFNGWGNKFTGDKDNKVNQWLCPKICANELVTFPTVAEGGAIEVNDQHHLLSTAMCLFNPQRNKGMTQGQYSQLFSKALGAEQFTIFAHGHLEGDDTDGHIDTLVRFAPDNHMLIQTAYNRPDDDHYTGLNQLLEEVKQAFPDHQLHLLPLPNIVNDDGERLPASYANFLINNQQVLCPIYQQQEDQIALAVMAAAFPNHQIVAVNCLPLIQQFGSLHCISMQVPKGTLQQSLIEKFNQGVITL